MRAFALAATFVLAACQPPEPVANDVANDTVNAPVENVVEPVVNETSNVANSATNMPPFAEVKDAHPYPPVPAPIPAKFRGSWAESNALCGNLAHHNSLVISGRTVRHPDFVIFGDDVTLPAPNQFALKGHIEATGAPAEAHYAINAAGDVLTDGAGGGTVRVRCP